MTLSETPYGVAVLQLNGDNEMLSSCQMTFAAPLGGSRLDMNGHSPTLAAINGDANAVIEGLLDNTGLNTDSTLTVNNAGDCSFLGVIRNSLQGSGTGKVTLVKNGVGDLLLGGSCTYTGATTLNSGTLQVTGSLLLTSGVSVASGATLYFNNSSGYSCTAPITGTGAVQIYQGANGFNAGTGYNTSLSGFSGPVSVTSGAVAMYSANALGSGAVTVSNGGSYDLTTSTTTTFSIPITLSGIGGAANGVTKPALYGDGSGGLYTVSSQITLAASSDVGNAKTNGPLTISGQITGPGGLVVENTLPTLTSQSGTVTITGATSNDYTGGTTINRGTVYLQKTGGAIAIPGDVTISAGGSSTPLWNTYVALQGSNQIAATAVMSFTGGACLGYFEMLGNDQTLAGINDSLNRGIIENAEQQTGITNLATLTINNTADCAYKGTIRNGDLAPNGASTGLLAQ